MEMGMASSDEMEVGMASLGGMVMAVASSDEMEV
jgi:hypothetical protein